MTALLALAPVIAMFLNSPVQDGDQTPQSSTTPAATPPTLPQPSEKALTRGDLERGAAQGDPVAMYRLGLLAESQRDAKTAAEWYLKAAKVGNAPAMTRLGYLRANALGGARDEESAVGWYRKAAELGDGEAMSNLGVMLANGRGVTQNDVEAVTWYRRAADAGNATAMFNLASMYARGRGVGQSEAEAIAWYMRAAEKGNAPAMNNLGEMYANGKGVPANPVKAAELYRSAADGGNAEAMCNLALAYAQAKGVERNLAEAHFWALLGQSTGDGDIETRAAQLVKRLTAQVPADKAAESRTRVTAWIAAHAAQTPTK
jgi:hypothetical protein